MALRVITSLLGHLLNKGDVGLDQVDNTSDANKPIGTATATALAGKATTAALAAHTGDVGNPHAVTKAQVGLGSADNTSDAGKPVSTAQATAIALKADASALTAHTGDTGNPHSVTKAQVGLGSVDNTSDAAKPISTATATALAGKQPLDSDLTTIAAMTGADGSFIGRSGGAFALRTAAQTKVDLALDNVPNTKHNLVATTGPGAANDTTQGYSEGSIWVNTTLNIAYICTDAGTGAALWRNLAFVTSASSPLVESGGGLSLGPTFSQLLDYDASTEAADLANNTSFSASTWTDMCANKSFTVIDGAHQVEIAVRGIVAIGTSSLANTAARLVVDGTPVIGHIGGGINAGSGAYANALAGGGTFKFPGTLATGAHTVKTQFWCNIAGVWYCRAKTGPNFESLHIQVVESY